MAITIDTIAPGTPTAIAISDDLGASATDFLTSDSTLALRGFAEPGAVVEVQLAGQVRRALARRRVAATTGRQEKDAAQHLGESCVECHRGERITELGYVRPRRAVAVS